MERFRKDRKTASPLLPLRLKFQVRLKFLQLLFTGAMILTLLSSSTVFSAEDKNNPLIKTTKAMGGLSNIQGLKNQIIVSKGERFEPGQTFSPDDPPRLVSKYQSTLTMDFITQNFRTDWELNFIYPYQNKLEFAQVIQGNKGYINGSSGRNAPEMAAMPSVQLAVLKKYHILSSPLLLIRQMLKNPDKVKILPNRDFQGRPHLVFSLANEVSPIFLYVDQETRLPSKTETLEDDPYYGDSLIEVLFSDWRKTGGLFQPFSLVHRFSGVVLKKETRSSIINNTEINAELMNIPRKYQTAYNADDALRGVINAQWFLRRQAIGFPSYADQSRTVAFKKIAPNLYFVTSGSHNNLIIERPTHLVVLEAPLTEARTQAVIAKARTLFSEKPIRYLINSHFHIDHGGGIRGYMAEGATLVVGGSTKNHYEEVLKKPHTLVPDAFYKNPRTPKIMEVKTVPLKINDGDYNIEIYRVENSHAEDLILVYLPKDELIFLVDIFSPQGDFRMEDLPMGVVKIIEDNNLKVSRVAGGHGGVGNLIQ